jgi:hypothetical protein
LLTGAKDGPSNLREPSSDAEDIIPFAIAENPTATNKGSREEVSKGGKTNPGAAGFSNT